MRSKEDTKKLQKLPWQPQAYMKAFGTRFQASFRLRFVTMLAHMTVEFQWIRKASSSSLEDHASQ